MADLCGDYEGFANVTELSCSGGSDIGRFATATPHMLTDSGSFKEDGKGSRRQTLIRRSLEAAEFLNLLHGSVPLKVGLNQLENEVGVGNVVRSGVQSQLVCSGCQKLLQYVHGATSVCCAVCNAVMNVPLPGTEVAQLVCGGCHTLLMYIRGATSVQCSCCHTFNLASEANQIAHVNCGNCCTLLMYQYGAGSVKCAVCNFLTSVGR